MALAEGVDNLAEIVPDASLVSIDLAGGVVLVAARDQLRIGDVAGLGHVPRIGQLAVVRNLCLDLQRQLVALLYHCIL